MGVGGHVMEHFLTFSRSTTVNTFLHVIILAEGVGDVNAI
jgi:hypothetical protein